MRFRIVVSNTLGVSGDSVISKYFGEQVGSTKIFDRLFSAAGGLPQLMIAGLFHEHC